MTLRAGRYAVDGEQSAVSLTRRSVMSARAAVSSSKGIFLVRDHAAEALWQENGRAGTCPFGKRDAIREGIAMKLRRIKGRVNWNWTALYPRITRNFSVIVF